MATRPWKLFLDTSALIAGIVSPSGAAREVLRLCEVGVVVGVISRQVLTEADRTFSEKLPLLVSSYRELMRGMGPLLVDDPSRRDVVRAEQVIHKKDAPILAAATNASVDYLITWNTRHLLTPAVRKAVRFRIMTSGEFLVEFREEPASP
jgi:predicted nucleic acid-binding protein